MSYRILFDLSPAAYTPGGTRTYIENLSRALQSLEADSAIELAVSELPAWLRPRGPKGLAHKLRVVAWDTYYMNLLLPGRALSARADLLHTPALRLPLLSPVPTVTTIHDVLPVLFPGFYRLRDRLTLTLYLRLNSRRATHIITVSEQSRRDIHKCLGVSLDKISVTLEGVSPSFRPVEIEQVEAALARYHITPPYILTVCTLEPRKNLGRVLQMFAMLRQWHGLPHRLVLVGRRGWLESPIFAEARRLGLTSEIIFTGFVPDGDLPALYRGAEAFVYPALYEGFGLPPLEAMACGCPVVVSNTSALPEVVGQAGLLVDPLDVEALSQAVLSLLTDRSLAEAQSAAGLQRAAQFSWRRCAEATLAVYQRVLDR